MQGKKRRKGRQKQKKSAVLAPQAARQPAYTPEWCTHTHTLLLRPISPLHFAAKKAKGKVFHTHTHTSNWHLISQPKGWLAQRWLRLCLCPTQRTTLSSHWPWDLPLSCFSTLLSFLLPLSPPFFISSLPPSPSPLSFLPLLFCLFSLFPPHSVLHHSALPLSFHTAREGSRGKTQALERKKKREREGIEVDGGEKNLAGSPFVCRRSVTVLVADEI